MSTYTIDTAVAKRLAEASAIRGASIVGKPGGWSVMIKMGMVEKPLGTQRTDKPRTWRSLDSCVQYLRDELQIMRVDMLDASNYSTGDVSGRQRPDSAQRLKRAHEAAAYDAWFREQVQASIDDPRPSLTNDEASAHMERVFARFEKKARH